MGKILIIGADGLIGRSLYYFFSQKGYSVIGTSRRADSVLEPFDLINPDFSRLDLRQFSHAFICAARCNVRQCEDFPSESYRCNVQGTLLAVEKLCEQSVFPVLFSSDYVFDGIKGLYTERDLLNPLNEYGRQKKELEQRLLGKNCTIFRLSKVYDLSLRPFGLIGEIVHTIMQGKVVRAACDQIFSPLFIDDLNIAAQKIVDYSWKGLYHLCGPEVWKRSELAMAIAKKLGAAPEAVQSIHLTDLQELLMRPKNTSMYSHLWEGLANQKFTPLSSNLESVLNVIQESVCKGKL